MTTLSKDEIIALAREAQQQATTAQERTSFLDADLFHTKFATLCRADLVAENETLRYEVDAIAGIKQERDALRAELSALRAGSGEAVAWMGHSGGVRHLTSQWQIADAHPETYDTPLYTHPQPSAVPVVTQLVEALGMLVESVTGVDQTSAVNDSRAAITTGQQWLKENT